MQLEGWATRLATLKRPVLLGAAASFNLAIAPLVMPILPLKTMSDLGILWVSNFQFAH